MMRDAVWSELLAAARDITSANDAHAVAKQFLRLRAAVVAAAKWDMPRLVRAADQRVLIGCGQTSEGHLALVFTEHVQGPEDSEGYFDVPDQPCTFLGSESVVVELNPRTASDVMGAIGGAVLMDILEAQETRQ